MAHACYCWCGIVVVLPRVMIGRAARPSTFQALIKQVALSGSRHIAWHMRVIAGLVGYSRVLLSGRGYA